MAHDGEQYCVRIDLETNSESAILILSDAKRFAGLIYNRAYHKEEFANARDNYYSEGDITGRKRSRLADCLGDRHVSDCFL